MTKLIFRSWIMGNIRSMWISYRSWRMNVRGQDLQTYRTAVLKPERMSTKRFELFHKRRPVLVALQAIALSALAIWTLSAYVTVFKSLSFGSGVAVKSSFKPGSKNP